VAQIAVPLHRAEADSEGTNELGTTQPDCPTYRATSVRFQLGHSRRLEILRITSRYPE
jgi:hypothetical protein